MVDIENKKENAAVASQTEAAPAPQYLPAQEMSKGEKWYDWLVYKGLNYWTNLGITVLFTDWFNNGWKGKRTGRELFHLPPNVKGQSQTFISSALTFLALSSGGTILLAPLKLLEDRKRPLVHWLNKKFGVDQHAPDGHEMTPDEIYIEKEQPHHSWFNVIWRRALGMLAIQAAGATINATFKVRDPHGNEKNDIDGADVLPEFVLNGKDGQGGLNRIFKSGNFPMGKWLHENRAPQQWMRYFTLDSGLTAITAAVMWFTRGAQKAKMPHEIGDNAPPANESFVKEVKLRVFEETKESSPKKFTDNTVAPVASHAERVNSEPSSQLQVGV